eukprot:1524895-Amphidinium_carterae.1
MPSTAAITKSLQIVSAQILRSWATSNTASLSMVDTGSHSEIKSTSHVGKTMRKTMTPTDTITCMRK